ncbi:hypothetical protein [Candidatus Halobonum tyrrellensis]|uniref:hypothetical protein n=1 Tax=Candidatus Halobonum tyrrellensis TaxID=1431545 RepID=UPI001269124D|nr:hypothetical protein [Candidatus Halobonum tyrrellensis]
MNAGMEPRSEEGVGIEFDETSKHVRIKPNPDEQLPLDVCSAEGGCFVFDNNGAELRLNNRRYWKKDPKAIVWMAQDLREVYETPHEVIEETAGYEVVTLFYDSEYPDDDVPHKERTMELVGPSRELPPLDGHDSIEPQESPLTVKTDDWYAEDHPSTIQIVDGEEVLREWTVEHTEDGEKNPQLGAEVAWAIRLAYERPWELRDQS